MDNLKKLGKIHINYLTNIVNRAIIYFIARETCSDYLIFLGGMYHAKHKQQQEGQQQRIRYSCRIQRRIPEWYCNAW